MTTPTAPSTAPASALIVRLSSIGDVVHTLPAYQALRAAWPRTRFGWAVETAASDLIGALDDLRVHVLPVQTWRRSLASPTTWGQIRRARRSLRDADYELAIDFQGLLKSALVARASGARVIGLHAGDAREPLAARLYSRTAAPLPKHVHAVERGLHLARAAGAPAAEIEYPGLVDDAVLQRVRQQLRELGIEQYAVLHSAANWPSKRYPQERLVEAARGIHQRTGLPVLWIWGPGERQEVRRLADAAGPGSLAAFETRLPELSALLRGASVFLGGDSAPLHLAVALGAPVVAIFGPTDPAILGPVRSEDVVVQRVLECSYCHRRQCPIGTLECLESISPEQLVAAVEERLRRAG